jgi:hypothetical protein
MMTRPIDSEMVMRPGFSWRARWAVVVLVVVGVFGVSGSVAGAAGLPWWHLQSGARPSFLAPEGKGEIVATVSNLGDASSGGVVTLTDMLPAGLSARSIEAEFLEGQGGRSSETVSCSPHPLVERPLVCTFSGAIPPYSGIEVRVGVVVNPRAAECTPKNVAACERNVVSMSGGGAAGSSISRPVVISEEPVPFGIEAYEVTPEEVGGAPAVQAGSHPFQVTGTLTVNQLAVTPSLLGGPGFVEGHPAAFSKDLAGLLPPGLIGNPTPFATCTLVDFFAEENCPARSVVGVAVLTFNEPRAFDGLATTKVPVVKLEPAHGEAARFGFLVTAATPVFLDAHVRSSGDYGVTLGSSNITQLAALLSYELTFWGVPGDPAHNSSRGTHCLHGNTCVPLEEEAFPPPFLAMPTSCTGRPLQTSTETDSWNEPRPEGQRLLVPATEPMPTMVGCNRLSFEPHIEVAPDEPETSISTGLSVNVHVPQESILDGQSLAESAVKGITVALPEGVAVNPAGGDGLQACSESLIGFEGYKEFETSPGLLSAAFTPTLPEPSCPTASKIGTAEISTPLLPPGQHLKGAVYLATQNENPFGSLIALYILAEDPISGTLVRLPGETHLTETGQIITTFKDNPQLAFEDATLHFFGGERAPLATPAHCGSYTTTAAFTPWSAEPWDEAALIAHASSTFDITSGAHGTPCPGPSLPFTPALTGGTTNINAGGYTPLTTTITRADGQQNLQTVQLHMPPGVSGILAGVPLCPEAQANAGTCPEGSMIGETTVSAGVGSDPVSVKGGRVYLTEKYAGAPFGLSIVNPVKAGPFDLEHDTSNPNQDPPCDCIVVRARIEINPITAALTVTTDETGPHAIPHIIDGVPVQIKAVNVTITRQHFTINPTNCNPMSITGTITSNEDASAPVSVPLQVTNCAALKFQPKITVTTPAQASKANGASLTFNVSYPPGAQGQDAWFQEAKFDLPKQLPARLGTLQQACLAATFETNPANCPHAALIGHATVHTQVLPVPLQGPVYFVSYGGAKFPEAVLVLQGYGITVDLHGETYINNATGITSATFKSTPDVPFENIEVTIPEGPYSEFGANLPANANYNFCGQTLTMPTHFKAQNGQETNQNTPITITGCKTTETKTQRLAKALKACKKDKAKRKRAACENAARKKYATKASKKGKARK